MIRAQCEGFYNTPPLWEMKQFEIQQFDFPSLDLQSFVPNPIPKNIRIGHQMEYIFQQLVEYSDAYDIVLNNLAIRKKERTLGEIDFILKDRKLDKLIHVELTYKFYVIDPEIKEPIRRLIGPNRRDSFFDKMEKIKNVQFPLLHSNEGAKALNEKNIDHQQLEHQCCFKAQLFQPLASKQVAIGALNKDCLVGYCLNFDEFNTSTFAKADYYVPSKSEWVIQPNDQVKWKSHDEILKEIDLSLLNERAPMIWMKKSRTIIEKLFVVWW